MPSTSGVNSSPPFEAAALFDQTKEATARQIEPNMVLLSLLGGVVFLVAYGAIWQSVRHQHPYKGPTVVGLVGLYAAVLIRIATVLRAHRRAAAGMSEHGHHQFLTGDWTVRSSVMLEGLMPGIAISVTL